MLKVINLFLGSLNLGLFLAFHEPLNGIAAFLCLAITIVQSRNHVE